MADRYPAVEDFDEGQPPSTNGNFDSSSGNADQDFLARERAALGEDAAFFDTGDAYPEGGGGDLLGGAGSYQGGAGGGLLDGDGGGEDITEFESSFPSVDTRNDQVGPGGTITGSDVPFRPSQQPNYGAAGYGQPVEEESEPIRQWRERRNASLEERSKISSSKKEETVKAARANIDDFYENYSSKTEKGIQRTRKEAEEFLEKREDTTAGGTSWERIGKLVDLSGKGGKGGGAGGGKEKFREMLLDLRKDEKAPGATGI